MVKHSLSDGLKLLPCKTKIFDFPTLNKYNLQWVDYYAIEYLNFLMIIKNKLHPLGIDVNLGERILPNRYKA